MMALSSELPEKQAIYGQLEEKFSDYSGDDTCDDDSVHYTGTLYDKESGKADRADGSGY